ncbi:hypothetical protein [Microbulbifer sp. ZKSA002]|uniref:hypothetical protein n=1 Tax=Microbulbifer sp. ZKSA002 TaxID=3243388 RepID=UPI0040394DBD
MKKSSFWGLPLVLASVAVVAATYYTTMTGDIYSDGEVNAHIRSEVNQSVNQWKPGDVVVVQSGTTGQIATYQYHPLYGKHFITSGTGGESGGSSGGSGSGDGGFSTGGSSGSGFGYGNDECDTFVVCTDIGNGGT